MTSTSPRTPWAALPVLLAGAFIVVLDFFIVNVALPSIATELGAGLARVAQGIAGAVVMPQVLAIVGVSYKGADYVRAVSIYGVVLGLAAVGVAVTGVIYFGASGAGQAFELALIQLAVVAAGIVAASRLLPARAV